MDPFSFASMFGQFGMASGPGNAGRFEYKSEVLDREKVLAQWEEDRRMRDPGVGRKYWYNLNFGASGGGPKAVSNAAIGQLERVTLDEMWGKYFLGRIASRPILNTGLSFYVEDSTGRIEMISLYNYPLKSLTTGPDLDYLFPLGDLVAIKEPWYKPAAASSGCLIRVESPSDVVHLSHSDPLISDVVWSTASPASRARLEASFAELKDAGNKFYAEKKYLPAIKAYSDGISNASVDGQDDTSLLPIALLNRSAAHLVVENFRSARSDAVRALALLSATKGDALLVEKGLWRGGKAEEGMRLYEEAKASYEAVLAHAPTRDVAKEGCERMARRLREAEKGAFEWCKMFKKGFNTAKHPRQEVADFVGPIEIKETEEREGGRGVFATRDIEPGTLLLVEKAFAIEYQQKDSSVLPSINLRTGTSGTAADVALVRGITSKLLDDPSLGEVVYSLYAGPGHPSPRPFPETPGARLDGSATCPIDVARIEDVCSYNSFGAAGVEEVLVPTPGPPPRTSYDDLASALFIRASIFNHSCAPSALCTTFGDVMVVRARENIKEGDEIFITYTSREVRDQVLSKHFPHGCMCKLCRAEGRDPVQALRRARLEHEYSRLADLVRPHAQAASVPRTILQEIRSHIRDLENTYPSTFDLPRLALQNPYHLLGDALNCATTSTDLKESVDASFKSLLSTGVSIRLGNSPPLCSTSDIMPPTSAIRTGCAPIAILSSSILRSPQGNLLSLFNATKFRLHGKPGGAKMWIRIAMALEEVEMGGGKEFFRARYGRFMSDTGLIGVFEKC